VIAAIVGVIVLWKGEAWRAQYINWCLMHGIYLTIIIYLMWMLIKSSNSERFPLPKIKTLRDEGIIVTDYCNWLGVRVAVSIFVLDDRFEQFLCSGEVINIQQNGLVQIRLFHPTERIDVADLISALKSKNSENVLIKPAVAQGV
jgi:hypothetical protein